MTCALRAFLAVAPRTTARPSHSSCTTVADAATALPRTEVSPDTRRAGTPAPARLVMHAVIERIPPLLRLCFLLGRGLPPHFSSFFPSCIPSSHCLPVWMLFYCLYCSIPLLLPLARNTHTHSFSSVAHTLFPPSICLLTLINPPSVFSQLVLLLRFRPVETAYVKNPRQETQPHHTSPPLDQPGHNIPASNRARYRKSSPLPTVHPPAVHESRQALVKQGWLAVTHSTTEPENCTSIAHNDVSLTHLTDRRANSLPIAGNSEQKHSPRPLRTRGMLPDCTES